MRPPLAVRTSSYAHTLPEKPGQRLILYLRYSIVQKAKLSGNQERTAFIERLRHSRLPATSRFAESSKKFATNSVTPGSQSML